MHTAQYTYLIIIFTRLITSEMTLDGSEKVTSHGSQTVCEASIKHLLVRECLYSQGTDFGKPEGFDLIRFESVGKYNLMSFDNCEMVTSNGAKRFARRPLNIGKGTIFCIRKELTLTQREASI